jgi:hypothetical protein
MTAYGDDRKLLRQVTRHHRVNTERRIIEANANTWSSVVAGNRILNPRIKSLIRSWPLT